MLVAEYACVCVCFHDTQQLIFNTDAGKCHFVNEIAEMVLGQTVQTIEDGDSNRIIAYPGGYGSPSEDGDITLMKKFPHYPTKFVAEVETEEVEDGHRITRARQIDTSNLNSGHGEWYDLSDVESSTT